MYHGSNNPFAGDPRADSVRARYPDLTGQDPASGGFVDSQYTSWLNRPSTSPLNTSVPPYANQAPMSPQGYDYQSPQPLAQQWTQGGFGFVQPQQAYPQSFSPQPQPLQQQTSGMPFTPSSSFGQQLAAHVQGGAYGGMPGQPQQQQQFTGYAPQSPQYGPGQGYQLQQQPQMQMQPQPQYFPEFDPLAAGSAPGSRIIGSSNALGSASSGYKSPHPREYVHSHKAELEQWDETSWKQVENCLNELKQAWEARKKTLQDQLNAMRSAGMVGTGGYGMYGGGAAQQYAQYESLAKEADYNVDSITASSVQLEEVAKNYRQSGDNSSKRRVRESMNAAIKTLPDFP